jgi:hypothetical protein
VSADRFLRAATEGTLEFRPGCPYWVPQILDDLLAQRAGLEKVGYRSYRETGRHADHSDSYPLRNDCRSNAAYYDEIPDCRQRVCHAVLMTARLRAQTIHSTELCGPVGSPPSGTAQGPGGEAQEPQALAALRSVAATSSAPSRTALPRLNRISLRAAVACSQRVCSTR